MTFPGFERAASSTSTAPIRGYSRRGFVIGWFIIIGLAAAGYMFASSQLSHSSAQLRLANIAGTVHTVLAPS